MYEYVHTPPPIIDLLPLLQKNTIVTDLHSTHHYEFISSCLKYSCSCCIEYTPRLRGSLHESGLSYNPDRSHFVSVETIGDEIMFVT